MPALGLEAARENVKKKVQDVHFEPKATDLNEPKEGEHDDKDHHGGNKWAGGVSDSAFNPTFPILIHFDRPSEEIRREWEAEGATSAFTKEGK